MLETWRRCWRCDCDGESHRGAGYEPTGAQAAVFAMAAHIEELTGSKPPTCPWRAMYSPLVGEVIRCANLAEKGALAPYVGTDPDARLMDALASYLAARGAVRAHDMEQEHKRREAERKRPRRG